MSEVEEGFYARLSEDDIDKIASILSLDKKNSASLWSFSIFIDWLDTYFLPNLVGWGAVEGGGRDWERTDEQHSQLLKLQRHLQKLLQFYEECDPKILELVSEYTEVGMGLGNVVELQKGKYSHIKSTYQEEVEDVNVFFLFAKQIYFVSSDLVSERSTKKGRPGQGSLDTLVQGCAVHYRFITGELPTLDRFKPSGTKEYEAITPWHRLIEYLVNISQPYMLKQIKSSQIVTACERAVTISRKYGFPQ